MSVATVSEISVKSFLVDENGDKKELSLGDELQANDLVVTTHSNESMALKLLLSNGKSITMQGLDMLKLDSSVTQDSSFDIDESVVHNTLDLDALFSYIGDLYGFDFASSYSANGDDSSIEQNGHDDILGLNTQNNINLNSLAKSIEGASIDNVDNLKLKADDLLVAKEIKIIGEKDSPNSKYTPSEHSNNIPTFIIEPEQV